MSSSFPKRSGKDRRGAQRHLDRFYVRLISEDERKSEVCELKNISTGGLALAAPKEMVLTTGGTIAIELPLGRSTSRVHTRCTICDQTAKDGLTLHLQFLDKSPIFVATVDASIKSWQSRPQRDRRGERE